MNNNKNEETSNIDGGKILNLAMPIHKLLFLLLITFTLYTPFWFYYKCKYFRDAKIRNILFALSTGIPFLCVIPLFILYQNLLDLIYIKNKTKTFFIAFSLSFLLFTTIYITFLYFNITSSLLFSICFYIPSLLAIQFLVNKKEEQSATQEQFTKNKIR